MDLLGYGQSPKPWTRYTVERHVEALHGVLADRGPFTLVGHSFGAIAALAYAARHPQDVSGLVLIGLPYFGGLERAYAYYRSLDSPDGWLMTNLVLAAITCIVTRRLLGRLLPRLLKDLPREVAEDLVHHTWLSSLSTIWDGVYRYNSQLDAERLPSDIPVLMLHGERDVTAPVEGARALADFNPNWELQIVAGADHHLILRDPVGCRVRIAAWMESWISGAGTRAVPEGRNEGA